MHSLGYRRGILRDDDKKPTKAIEDDFVASGGALIAWRGGRALEDELFLSLSCPAISKLMEYTIELHGEDLIDAHIKSSSQNAVRLEDVQAEMAFDDFSEETRIVLGKAARTRAGWFKTVGRMEEVAREIVAPDLPNVDVGFRELVEKIFSWAGGNGA